MQRIQGILRFFAAGSIPFMARQNYRAELRHVTLWALVQATIEPNMAAIIVARTFDAPPELVAVVWAIPVVALTLNMFWGALLRGRPRKRFYVTMGSLALACLAPTTLIPQAWGEYGGVLFAIQLAATHFFASALVTTRTSMWRSNYSAEARAQITARFHMVRTVSMMTMGICITQVFNQEPGAYRFVYPIGVLAGALSLVMLRPVRVRGERSELRRYEREVASHHAPDAPVLRRLGHNLAQSASILYRDRLFSAYLAAQFLMGSANFFTDPLLVSVIAGRGAQQANLVQLDFDYFDSYLLMYVMPNVLMLITMPIWSRWFDRVNVFRFRLRNTVFWVASYVLVTVSMVLIFRSQGTLLLVALPFLVLARLLKGVGHGGGAIAWNLGHLQFAREHQDSLYMSIHVALTGLRGLVMPLLAAVTMRWIGWGAFVVSIVLASASMTIFYLLDRRGTDEAASVEGPDPRPAR